MSDEAPRPGVGKVTRHDSFELQLRDTSNPKWLPIRILSPEERYPGQELLRRETVSRIWDELARMVELDRGLTSTRTQEMLMAALRKHDGCAP